ncbi:hypothetical protein K4039_22255 [Lyngbya sp. CCAP 1446/10]|uniref:hypothetical protein n=1 Tax=Lyngbya sp. CCAP 1446/10 TaxID=439293 RepID=UPI002237E0C6|nr:hypothetical protein [Lyngbya sp. CCAP 1446/10]MCW6052721.1 hypothetical protein [Lyngbya sp. CCAP 1446/10]
MTDILLCIWELSCCRPQFPLLKAEPQAALYFTSRWRDRLRAIDSSYDGEPSLIRFYFLYFRFKNATS